ncbi:hypothetical protein D3C71_2210500 [compost metagenome]
MAMPIKDCPTLPKISISIIQYGDKPTNTDSSKKQQSKSTEAVTTSAGLPRVSASRPPLRPI